MDNKTIPVSAKDIEQIKRDIELLKSVLLEEGELSEWAEQELEKARNDDEDSYISLEEL